MATRRVRKPGRKAVFISHISEEKDVAVHLKQALAKHFLGNVEVFVSSDGVSIGAGAPWLEAITKAVKRADIMVILCSPTSTTRPWINFECGAAWLQGTPIVPACHGNLTPAKLVPPLSYLQSISVVEADGVERLYGEIAKTLGCDKPDVDYASLAAELEKLSDRAYQRRKQLTPNVAELIAEKIDGSRLGWTLCFIGEDPLLKAGELVADLKRKGSDDGHGKRFSSGFAYVGIGPALAWKRAVDDPLYVMMQRSITSFPDRWRDIRKQIKTPMHYVSLGIGTGEKDISVLDHLFGMSSNTYFFPSDMSAEMLRVGINTCLKDSSVKRSKTLPIQIDFSNSQSIDSIGRVVSSIVGDGPVLYSILGNTLANFESDEELLKSLSRLLRPRDAMLIEIASTREASESALERMKSEYETSHHYLDFVTSALKSNTFISPKPGSIQFIGTCPPGRIELRVVYRNTSDKPEEVHLADGKTTPLAPNETICLAITRKYTVEAMFDLAAKASVEVAQHHVAEADRETGFSLACSLLKRTGAV